MIYLMITRNPLFVGTSIPQYDGVVAQIPDEHGPAFRSAIAEIRNTLGGRSEGPFKFDKENALTRAVSSIGAFAAAVNAVIPKEDPDYE